MKKVLITGATASQSSLEANKQKTRFSGLIYKALTDGGVSTELRDTEYQETFDIYDRVIIGLAPFTSLSANKIYTALDALNRAGDKAIILLDSPDPHLVYKSISSVLSNHSILSKSLYEKRLGFKRFLEDKSFSDSVFAGVERLASGINTAVIPSVPYYSHSMDSLRLGTESIIELNFDSYFKDDNFYVEKEKSSYWLADSNKSIWVKDIQGTVYSPVLNFKRSHYDSDLDLVERITGSFGYLKNNHKYDNPWWSRNIMLALSCGVPVFSDWRQTSIMGECWRLLPHTVETISHSERKELADEQKSSYLSFCPSWEEICEYSVSRLIK